MDDYSDDDLDHLPDSVFQELENNAIQLTQAQQQGQARSVPQNETYDILDSDEDLDDAALVNPQPPPLVPAGSRHAGRGLMPRPRNTAGLSTPRFQAPALSQHRQPPNQFPRAFAPPPPRYAPSQSQAANAHPHPNAVAALEVRIRALENDLHVSRGEVSILRNNSIKAQQTHEAEMARLTVQSAEQITRHQRLLDETALERKNATTELKFLQRDMQEVTSRARRKDTTGGPAGARITTPKKATRNWGVADGFEGFDLTTSPSKGLARNKPGISAGEKTPTKGKRKRPAAESPVLPLETHTPDADVLGDDDGDKGQRGGGSASPAATASRTLPFDFLPLILDHASAHGQPPTFDIFSRYFFPSDANTSFASIIFQSLSVRSDPQCPAKMLTDLGVLLVHIWVRCIEEQFLAPIQELVSLLTFILQLQTISVAPHLLDKLLPVAEKTLCIVAEARSQATVGDLSKDPDYHAVQANIDSTRILSLMYLVALASTTCTEWGEDGTSPRAGFWKLLSLHVVCLMLRPRQLLHDVVGMLNLLCTSVLPESLGPIDDDKEPSLIARSMLEKVSLLLVNAPVGALAPVQAHAVQAAVLRTLLSFSASNFGIQQLALHGSVLQRLVVLLSGAIHELYDQDISPDMLDATDGRGEGDEQGPGTNAKDHVPVSEMDSDVRGLCRVISQTTLLLHTLAVDPRTAATVDFNAKLRGRHREYERYQVALCRLNFAEENLVLEAGIDTHTSNMANDLLELILTPDDAKIIREAFSTGE